MWGGMGSRARGGGGERRGCEGWVGGMGGMGEGVRR